jgi:hypothetical protein
MTTRTQRTQNESRPELLVKPGRTLLVKSKDESNVSSSAFDNLVGLLTKVVTKTGNAYFLNFDNIENSTRALLSLTDTYNVKYSYYRVFFTLSNMDNTFDFNSFKTKLSDFVEKKNGVVLYTKVYRKDTKNLNCGYITVDTIDTMNLLLNKEGGCKEFTIDNMTGTFYRFNNSKVNTKSNVNNS